MRYRVILAVLLLATLSGHSQIGQLGIRVIGSTNTFGVGGQGVTVRGGSSGFVSGGGTTNALLNDATSAILLNDATGASLLNDNP